MRLTKQRGISLLEVMLGLSVVMLVGAYMMRDSGKAIADIDAKNYAMSMQQLYAAASNYAIANQPGIIAATGGTSPALYCMVNVNPANGTGGSAAYNTTKKTCAVDVTWLQWKGYLPTSFPQTTTEGSRWAVIYRLVGTTTLEGIVVAANSVGTVNVTPTQNLANRGDALEKAAELVGPVAGIAPKDTNQPCPWHATDNNQRYICGTQGAWRVKLGDFVN